ncbi:MAG: Ig-like domain-containing protein [Symbiobacterium sp.]|uniref:Ig-like domain-containing protein n=1 Tax=Symbiobacterium sp. TaxID=1971213 RepID=UPI0034643F9A
MRTRQNAIVLVVVLALILTAVAVIRPGRAPSTTPQPPEEDAAEVTLSPAAFDPAGLDPAGDLILTSRRPLTLAMVQSALAVEPAAQLRIEQADSAGTRFTIAAALEPDRVYRFRLSREAGVDRDYQWSFQTRTEFRLLGTLPAHRGTGVPVNTGIELTFSHDDYADPSGYVTFSPAIEGRWERHKKTAVFVPADTLQPGTIYTVTLKEGLGRTQGEGRLGAYTFQFETADPVAEGEWSAFHVFDESAEFGTGTVPHFRIWDKGKGDEYTVAVYRYSDAAGYIRALRGTFAVPGWSSVARDRHREPTEGLASVAAFTATPVEAEYDRYLALPEPLPAGYYLAEIQLGRAVRQVHFQVTDLSYYLAEGTTGGLVWLNDLATGRPAANAELFLPDGTPAATADRHGVARVEIPAGKDEDGQVPIAFWIARSGHSEAVVHGTREYWYWGDGEASLAELYWHYLYIDRSVYKPADTVHVWGIVHPREPEARPVDEVRVEVTRGWGDQTVLASATLPVERSSFIGSLELPNLTPGSYAVRVRVGEETFDSRWFEVVTYTKPAYQIEVTPDREALFSGERVTFKVRATFFDGTPVPDMKLDYHINSKDDRASVITDAAGEAVISYTPPHTAESWGWDESLFLYVTGGEPEVGEVYEERRIRLFQRDVMAQAETNRDGDQAVVTVQVNQVVLDQIEAGTGNDVQGPAVAGRPVEFTVIEQNWKRIEDGEYYDFIEKVVRKRYRYEADFREILQGSAETDGEGRAAFRFPMEPEKQYEVRYRVRDSRGLWLYGSAWISGRWYGLDSDWGWPQLVPAGSQRYRVPVGEPVVYVFQKGEVRLDDRPDGFLFFTARRGIREYAVQDSPSYTATLQAADLPNFTLYGVAFDGRSYLTATRFVGVDPEQRRLQVTVTPDRAMYRPGDEVQVQVAVSDAAGRPAAGALVNLNLVDEALYAVREQYVDILNDLYGNTVSTGIVRTRYSHEPPPMSGGAEKGGEGGSIRRDFKDAVLFTTVTTDDAGKATVSFRVPDNLTSWRLTYQAVLTGTMEAVSGAIKIPVSLPFFADLVMGESYLVGERPVFQVRAYGTALAAGAQVRYQVEVEGPSGHRQRLDLTGPAFDPVSIPLEPLPAEGTYTLRVTARSGSLTDALERTFAVRQTHLVEDRVDFRLLEPGTKLSGADDGLTYVTFLDWERGRYLNLLQRMRWLWGNRLEAKLGRTVAAELLEDYFGQGDASPEPELETMRYQTADGSVAFLPYSDGDLKLTALVADLAPERFDRSALAGYLRKVRADEGERRDRRAWALYGLAALDEPVLIDAHRLLADPEATPWERLCAMLAAATLGDLETVRPVYRTFMAQHGEEIGQDVRVAVGADRDEQLQATALAAILAARLGEPQAAALISYLMDNQPAEIVLHLEQLLAARSGLENLKGKPVGLTYRLNGQEHEKTLQPGERLALALRPEELASFEVTAVRGTAAAVVTYTRPGRPTVAMDGGRVVRTYSPAPETWKPGDIVTVTLTYSLPGDAPGGAYELTDTLPSGLRYLERRWAYGQRIDWSQYDSWALQVDGQRVTFWAGKNGKPIRYFARVVSGGEYRAEEAVLMHQKSGLVYAVSSPGAVSIAW